MKNFLKWAAKIFLNLADAAAEETPNPYDDFIVQKAQDYLDGKPFDAEKMLQELLKLYYEN